MDFFLSLMKADCFVRTMGFFFSCSRLLLRVDGHFTLCPTATYTRWSPRSVTWSIHIRIFSLHDLQQKIQLNRLVTCLISSMHVKTLENASISESFITHSEALGVAVLLHRLTVRFYSHTRKHTTYTHKHAHSCMHTPTHTHTEDLKQRMILKVQGVISWWWVLIV